MWSWFWYFALRIRIWFKPRALRNPFLKPPTPFLWFRTPRPDRFAAMTSSCSCRWRRCPSEESGKAATEAITVRLSSSFNHGARCCWAVCRMNPRQLDEAGFGHNHALPARTPSSKVDLAEPRLDPTFRLNFVFCLCVDVFSLRSPSEFQDFQNFLSRKSHQVGLYRSAIKNS